MSLIDTLRALAITVRNEKKKEANSAVRIGDLFIAIIDFIKGVQSGEIRQDGVDSYNDTSEGKTSLLNKYPKPELNWTVLVRKDETNGGKASLYKWNGSKWVNLETVVYNDDVAKKTELDCYDVSANNGSNTFTLEEAIAVVPTYLRKGGVKIKFVDSFSKEYVVYRNCWATWISNPEYWINEDIDWLKDRRSVSFTINKGLVAQKVMNPKLFTANEDVAFILLCDDGIVNKYAVLDPTKGVNIDGSLSNNYRYDTNKWYFVKPSVSMTATHTQCGLYVNAENAIGSGGARFIILPNFFLHPLYNIKSQMSDVLQNITTLSDNMTALGENVASLNDFNSIVWNSEGVKSKVLVPNSNQGIAQYPTSSLKKGETLAVYLKADPNIINKYAIVSNNGKDIVGNNNFYRFEPNKWYFLKPTDEFINNTSFWRPYVNAENAIGTGEVKFVGFLNIYENLTNMLLKDNLKDIYKLLNSFGLSNLLFQNMNIVQDSGSGVSNSYFPASSIVSGESVGIFLKADPGVVNKYAIITNNGQDIEGYYNYYRFEPNKWYFVKPTDIFIAGQWGAYVNAENAIGNGAAEFTLLTMDMLLKQMNDSTVKNTSDIEILKKGNSKFKGKTFAVLGDSLSENNIWAKKFAELTGATYDSSLNGYTSKGGTQTLEVGENSGMARALRLLERKPNVDVIFIQNINDMNRGSDGNLNDIPYMMTNRVVSSTIYATSSSAQSALANEISKVSPKIGTMICIPYGTVGSKFTIGNAATSNGNVTINIGENSYGISITYGMSVLEIQAKILEYDYSSDGYSDTASGTNAVIFTDTQSRGSSAPAINIDPGTTGIVFTKSDSSTVAYIGYCYMSKDIAEWDDTSKWKHVNSLGRYQIYAGLFEWLLTNFPKAEIYMCAFPRQPWGSSTPKYADGSYNWQSYFVNGTHGAKYLLDCQEKISKYYCIPFLNVAYECGITVFNASTFYPENNVHPYNIGYERWGSTVARIIE